MGGDAHPAKDDGPSIDEVSVHVDPAVSKKALRKIDLFFMPVMMIGAPLCAPSAQHARPCLTPGTGYGLAYYDKAILSSASLFGMTTDLGLVVTRPSASVSASAVPGIDTSRLSWATSIFYLGQLAGCFPMAYALQRHRLRRVMGFSVVIWAVVCGSTAGVRSWRGLLVQRFFLGMSSPLPFLLTYTLFLPSVIYILLSCCLFTYILSCCLEL